MGPPVSELTRSLHALWPAAGLLVLFITVNLFLEHLDQIGQEEQPGSENREKIPVICSKRGEVIAFHDFEAGSLADTSQNIFPAGNNSGKSLKLSPWNPFSPGLHIPFSELVPGDSVWLRASGYVWFDGAPGWQQCSLVATCNHDGVNYKYMYIPLEYEDLASRKWNRVSIDYRIPVRPAGTGDVLQFYFWYRGCGVILVDDIKAEVIRC